MSHPYVCHDSVIHVPWRIHTCDITNSYVWHDLYGLHSRHQRQGMCFSYVWHDSSICVPWLIHTCAMTHSYVWHYQYVCVTLPIHTSEMNYMWLHSRHEGKIWVIHKCDMNYPYVCHDSFIHVPWLIHTCDITNLYLWHVATEETRMARHLRQKVEERERKRLFSFQGTPWSIHGTRVNETCRTRGWVMWYIRRCHDKFECVMARI